MTDPFADLERELLAAHARDLSSRRHLRAAPRALALAATAAAFAVIWLGGETDAERAASPPPQPAQEGWTAYAPDCGEPWQPALSAGEVPPELSSRLAVLLSGRPAPLPDLHLFGAQASRIYGTPIELPRAGRREVSVIAAAIVPRARTVRQRDVCAEPEGDTEAGACLLVRDRSGGLAACFTVAELEQGEAFIDVDDHIIGLAPDEAVAAVAGDAESEVRDNSFRLPGGPQTRVSFRFARP